METSWPQRLLYSNLFLPIILLMMLSIPCESLRTTSEIFLLAMLRRRDCLYLMIGHLQGEPQAGQAAKLPETRFSKQHKCMSEPSISEYLLHQNDCCSFFNLCPKCPLSILSKRRTLTHASCKKSRKCSTIHTRLALLYAETTRWRAPGLYYPRHLLRPPCTDPVHGPAQTGGRGAHRTLPQTPDPNPKSHISTARTKSTSSPPSPPKPIPHHPLSAHLTYPSTPLPPTPTITSSYS